MLRERGGRERENGKGCTESEDVETGRTSGKHPEMIKWLGRKGREWMWITCSQV